MKITDALVAEHRVLYTRLDSVEASLDRASLERMKTDAQRLYTELKDHADLEHELLFTAVAAHSAQPQTTISAMRNEHIEIEDSLFRLSSVHDAERARLLLTHAIGVARDHMLREDQVYFKRARQILGDQRLEELGEEFVAHRRAAARG